MTTDTRKAPAPETKPEHSLSFAEARRRDTVWNLWAKPTTDEWWLAEADGQFRAVAVLGLDVSG